MNYELFDIKECTSVEEALFEIRTLVTNGRQFSYNGALVISSPKVGARNTPTPQPTPPVTSALRAAA